MRMTQRIKAAGVAAALALAGAAHAGTVDTIKKRGELVYNGGLFSVLFPGVPTNMRINSPSMTFDTWADSFGNMGAASHHPGGATFALGDAAVVFLDDSIDFVVYNYLGGRADGNAASIP